MISQEEGERVYIQAFETELRTITQIEECSIEEENLLEGKPFSFKKILSPMFGIDPAL